MNLALDKCLVIRLGSRSSSPPSVCTYKLYNQPIKVSCSTKDLGVVVDDRLKFSEHISSIVHKALTRCRLIFKCFSSRNCDLLVKAYITYVRPLLEYCSSVWSPHHRYLIDKIEKVQKFFTKRIPGMWNIPYTERLVRLGFHSLERRRTVSDLVLCYKIVSGCLDTSLSSFLTLKTNLRTRGHDKRLNVLSFASDMAKFTFINRTIPLWNNLPSHIVNAPSIAAFKRSLFKSL